MIYLFLFLASLNITNFDINNRIFELSLLTIQLSASSSTPESFQLTDLSLEDRHRLCIDDLNTMKESLEKALADYNTCKDDEAALQSKYDMKRNVCRLMKEDYKKYCRDKLFKSADFDRQTCRSLLENVRSCLDEKKGLGRQLKEKSKECKQLKKKVDEYSSIFSQVDQKCSKLESEILRHRSQTELRLVEDEEVMEKSFSSLTRSDAQLLFEIVRGVQRDLEYCLKELNELSERLAMKADNIYETSEAITTALGSAISKNIGISGKKKASSGLPALEQRLKTLKDQQNGVKKLLLQKENECRNLQTKLRKAQERLRKAESRPETHERRPERCGCFSRFTGFVTRTCRRLAGRFRRGNNNRARRASTRF
ncbi:signal peptide containing protein [Cryptosporidium sp. chipmunk genotype I]|uniref:signal peptide containing protein n=1 Tax=Cryptosporidium sp. chipmunk genotype I TaxID=1280935 RepID=UPI003519D88E|nr:signal peptide containing protein [Cryptosporidium sp. chipmunk genotype I]